MTMETSYTEEMKRLRRINERQREENMRLMSVIEPKRIFPRHWKISFSMGMIINLLLAAKGPMSTSKLSEHINFFTDFDPSYFTVRVHIFRIRKALQQDGIILYTIIGSGYYLTPENKAKALAVIAKAGGEL